ncbi:aminoacyl-tRNA hydrolase [Xiamenia xianingshaonis]|uniref:aminoacyl-tRNA hydrolase n=1 Tax=Xiamenia xianingshaonis TaxID=2682776 RepID=UPI0028F73D4D|nr:aminoacyl-tRNA hydrolase [Xiamenia xianingshaonis]
MSETYLIVGLGNPGEEYAHTRHNAGFDTIDKLAEEVGVRYWKTECGALAAKEAYRDCDVVLAKPQSYMNTSGGPVKQLMNAYGVSADRLVVIHDELDIAPDAVRAKFGGGHAGHNGLRSICDKLGTRDWFRVRVGIGRPPGRMPVVDWVLSRPKKEAADDFEYVCDKAAQATLCLITEGLDQTQQRFNS